MESSKLALNYDEQFSAFKHYFEATVRQQDIESIHALRVAIKNIKALLYLTEISSKGQFIAKKHFELYSSLFKAAGKVREVQLNTTLINSIWGDLSFYIAFLEEQQTRLISELLTETATFDFSKLETENIKLSMDLLPEKTVEFNAGRFVTHSLRKVKKRIRKNTQNTALHKIRCYLKPAMEMLLLQTDLTYNKQSVIENELKTLYRKIGNWHDQAMLIASMKEFNRSHRKEQKDPNFKDHIKMLELQNKGTRKKICSLLDKQFS